MLDVRGLKKTFPTPVPFWRRIGRAPARVSILENISFNVDEGGILGVLGANGAGKSTLLHILAGLIKADAGTIDIRGSVGLCSSAERSFYYRLTLRENLRFFGSLVGLRASALDRRIDELLEITDLANCRDRSIATCSSGMRQRATIARALLKDPAILLLDEPTRMLDPIHTTELHRFIREQLVSAQRKTVILATNLLDEAWKVCDRVALLNAGRLVALDTPDVLLARATQAVRYRIACTPIDDHLIERVRRDGERVVSFDESGLVVEIAPEASRFTRLLKALTENGLLISAISREEPLAPVLFQSWMSGHE